MANVGCCPLEVAVNMCQLHGKKVDGGHKMPNELGGGHAKNASYKQE